MLVVWVWEEEENSGEGEPLVKEFTPKGMGKFLEAA